MTDQFEPIRNAPYDLDFSLYNYYGEILPGGATYSSRISKDNGLTQPTTNSIVEGDTQYGKLRLSLTANEMDAESIWLSITSDAVGCVDLTLTIKTVTDGVSDIINSLSNLTATGYIVIGQGLGRRTYTDTLTSMGSPRSGVNIRAYKVLNDNIIWDEIIGMHTSDSLGEFTLYLDPGEYMLSFEKKGLQVATRKITVPEGI